MNIPALISHPAHKWLSHDQAKIYVISEIVFLGSAILLVSKVKKKKKKKFSIEIRISFYKNVVIEIVPASELVLDVDPLRQVLYTREVPSVLKCLTLVGNMHFYICDDIMEEICWRSSLLQSISPPDTCLGENCGL